MNRRSLLVALLAVATAAFVVGVSLERSSGDSHEELAAMVAFAALDVREVVHQLDEENAGLAVLAGVVAALHLGVAAIALSMGRSRVPAPRDSLA